MSLVKKVKERFKVTFGPKGEEILDRTPMALPAGFKRPESLQDQIRRLIRSEKLQQALHDAGYETEEEANDFDVGDDFDPSTPYEEQFEGEFDHMNEVRRAEKEVFKKRAAKAKKDAARKELLQEERPVRPDAKKSEKKPSADADDGQEE